MKRIIVMAVLVGTATIFSAAEQGRAASEVEEAAFDRAMVAEKEDLNTLRDEDRIYRPPTKPGDHLEASDVMEYLCSRANHLDQARLLKNEADKRKLAEQRNMHKKSRVDKEGEPKRTKSLPWCVGLS